MRKKIWLATLFLWILFISTACGAQSSDEERLLDPENPITITAWNYYNGSVKDKFDALVSRFNETVGAKKGITVEAQSYGDVNELADAVFSSADKEIGAMPMPDIFAAYPDNAFRIDQIAGLTDLKQYFPDEELSEIKEEFLSEGMFGNSQELKILPIAKSTEILYLNKMYWDDFAAGTGTTLDRLATWEGLVQTAKQYYEYTGKAFFSIDSNANFMLVSAMQLGEEMYSYHEKTASLNFSQNHAYQIWKNYYVPYINGYFTKSGRFSSDDARTGAVAAYTGSTAGASYFPEEVADGGKSVPVEVIMLPYPYYEGANKYAIQQGAGMCISQSDPSHEYASAMFLKWFIDSPQNTEFASSTAYLPVKAKALETDSILSALENEKVTNVAVIRSISTTMDMFKTYMLYGNRPFEGSYEARMILETSLPDLVRNDLETLNQRVENGEDRTAVINELTSEKHFIEWYQAFGDEMRGVLEQNREAL